MNIPTTEAEAATFLASILAELAAGVVEHDAKVAARKARNAADMEAHKARMAVVRAMTDQTNTAPFAGDFDFLPVRASLEFGRVPSVPSMADFDDAQSFAINADPFTIEGAAAVWQAEAVRWRRGNPDIDLDTKAIASATARRLFKKQADHMDR
jgi:hypothetical protein